MADEKIIFSMAGVNKIYPPSKQVLKNIYLSFFYGAKIGVLGLNGSGKSSLLRIIAGMDKEFQGEVVSDLSFTVGLLEQEPQLDKSKTVKEIVEEGVRTSLACLKNLKPSMKSLVIRQSWKIRMPWTNSLPNRERSRKSSML